MKFQRFEKLQKYYLNTPVDPAIYKQGDSLGLIDAISLEECENSGGKKINSFDCSNVAGFFGNPPIDYCDVVTFYDNFNAAVLRKTYYERQYRSGTYYNVPTDTYAYILFANKKNNVLKYYTLHSTYYSELFSFLYNFVSCGLLFEEDGTINEFSFYFDTSNVDNLTIDNVKYYVVKKLGPDGLTKGDEIDERYFYPELSFKCNSYNEEVVDVIYDTTNRKITFSFNKRTKTIYNFINTDSTGRDKNGNLRKDVMNWLKEHGIDYTLLNPYDGNNQEQYIITDKNGNYSDKVWYYLSKNNIMTTDESDIYELSHFVEREETSDPCHDSVNYWEYCYRLFYLQIPNADFDTLMYDNDSDYSPIPKGHYEILKKVRNTWTYEHIDDGIFPTDYNTSTSWCKQE